MITLEHVGKKYNKKIVLDDISLTVWRGQSVAFTGHNGCGKSTLLKIIAGLVNPTSGTVHYERPWLFHYVPEHFPKMNLTAGQYLTYMGGLDGLGREETEERIRCLSEDLFVSTMLDIPMKHLSKGSLQKIGVIQALLREPEVLLLDEPLSGQDVMSQDVFIRKIKELQEHKVTIFMSCHEPYLVDAIADVVYRFEDGHLSPVRETLRQKEGWYILSFRRQQGAEIPERWQGHLQFIGESSRGLQGDLAETSGGQEGGCNLRVPEGGCDRAILEMLGAGWSLRGMWNEDHG